MLVAGGYFLSELAACNPAYHVIKTEIVDDTLRVPLSSFAQSAIQFVRPQGWYYDIAVRKTDNGTYESLLLQCTHQQNQLVPAGEGYSCNLHGSRFGNDGTVIKGPAENRLKKYSTSIEQDKLVVHLKS